MTATLSEPRPPLLACPFCGRAGQWFLSPVLDGYFEVAGTHIRAGCFHCSITPRTKFRPIDKIALVAREWNTRHIQIRTLFS